MEIIKLLNTTLTPAVVYKETTEYPSADDNHTNSYVTESSANISLEYFTIETTNSTENGTTFCRNEYCISDKDYLDRIISYVFPTPFEWSLIAIYFVTFMMGLIGNFLVCFAVWRNHSMRTVTNYFIVNLAIADFLVVLICLPPTVMGDVTETWYMGQVMCKTVKYLQVSHI